MQKLILEKSSPFHLKLRVLFRFSLRAKIRTSSDVIKMYLMGCDERYRAILPHAFRLENLDLGMASTIVHFAIEELEQFTIT